MILGKGQNPQLVFSLGAMTAERRPRTHDLGLVVATRGTSKAKNRAGLDCVTRMKPARLRNTKRTLHPRLETRVIPNVPRRSPNSFQCPRRQGMSRSGT